MNVICNSDVQIRVRIGFQIQENTGGLRFDKVVWIWTEGTLDSD